MVTIVGGLQTDILNFIATFVGVKLARILNLNLMAVLLKNYYFGYS